VAEVHDPVTGGAPELAATDGRAALVAVELANGLPAAVATAGRTVVFSGLTVAASLAGLLLFAFTGSVVVPATMKLLGRWNWWAPTTLRRLHRRIGLDEQTTASQA
jgi:hypothetical protein